VRKPVGSIQSRLTGDGGLLRRKAMSFGRLECIVFESEVWLMMRQVSVFTKRLALRNTGMKKNGQGLQNYSLKSGDSTLSAIGLRQAL